MRLWVEASAGSGKTTDLIGTAVGLLASGEAQLGQMVAITFTEKAAGELKLRLREELERGLPNPNLRAALDQLELAQFSTIHGFCQQLLQEHPVEARVDPLFTVLDGGASQRIFSECFDDWFQSGLQEPLTYPGLNRLQRRRFHARDYLGRAAGLRPSLMRLAMRLAEHRDYPGDWVQPAPGWQKTMVDLVVQLQDLAPLFHEGLADWLKSCYRPIALCLHSYQIHRDPREQEAALCACHKALRGLTEPSPRLHKGNREMARALYECKLALEPWKRLADADLMARLFQELQPLLQDFSRRKARMGRLDFLDLLLRARELLRNAQIRGKLQQRYRYLFVDEFQDTDPIQAEIVELLGQNGLYLVGDPKQAIYRFRRGDPSVYRQFQARHQLEQRHLDKNYRSRPELVEYLNRAFEPVFQADDFRLQSGFRRSQPQRDQTIDQPAVLALPFQPRPNSPKLEQVRQEMAEVTALFLDWLLHASGFQVWDRQGWRPLQDRDVCLLFRAAAQNLEPILEQLDRRGLAHLSQSGRGLHQREEVAALRTALEAIERPQDRLSVFATLRGPLFGLDEPLLNQYYEKKLDFNPLLAEEAEDDPVGRVLLLLADLHRRRNQRPAGETLDQLVELSGFRLHLAQWPQGSQCLANLARLQRLSWNYEMRGTSSFRAFVDYLGQQAEEEGGTEGLGPDEGLPGVRVLTVHSSKGLEFPVVILADPATPPLLAVTEAVCPDTQRFACGLDDIYPEHFHELKDREEAILRAESERLAYVAATRARDLLVVPNFSDRESWLAPLVRALNNDHLWHPPDVPAHAPAPIDPALLFAEKAGDPEPARQSSLWRRQQQQLRQQAEVGLKILNRYPFENIQVEVVQLGSGGGNLDLGRRLHAALAVALPVAQADPDLQSRLQAIYSSSLWQPGWRELPLTCPIAEGVVLEGVADLVFQTPQGYTVVEFKSDGDRPEYHQQLAGYAQAIKLATGCAVRAVLAVV
ncbi:MAG: UvrD-helicase domain-containing protein [Vulcanimicrobiota bacterium]